MADNQEMNTDGFDPDETLPLSPDKMETHNESNAVSEAESQRLLNLLQGTIDQTASASLLSHLTSLREGGWNHTSYELALRTFRVATKSTDASLNGGMDPIIAKRMLTDAILPMASASPPSRNGDDWNGDSVWIAKLVRGVVLELLPCAFRLEDSVDNANASNSGSVNDGIKILLPTFFHRMDSDEASRILSDDSEKQTVDGILDQFCGLDKTCKAYPYATAGLLLALREFENISAGRLSRRRVWQKRSSSKAKNNRSFQQEYTFEYTDRPTSIINMAISSLEQLSTSKEPDALPPLVYQLGLIPMNLLQNESKVKAKTKGENEKQRGMRLRRMVLEGIASALEDGSLGSVNGASSSGVVVQGSKQNEQDEEWKWSRYTSLSHLGTCLLLDPEMSNAVLSMLGGEIISGSSSSITTPFRYQRLTPFKLAMGLSMASSVPRMRQAALGCIRDLILEEETIRIRCGLGRDGKRVGLGKPWMLSLVRCLEMVSSSETKEFQLENETGHVGHVLRCLIMVAKFAESSGHGGGGRVGGGSASSILQSLITLGFLLVDCVKKDEPASKNAVEASALLGSTLDLSVLNRISCGQNEAEASSNHATSCIGRVLLCYLFYQSAVESSHFMSSSLSRGSNEAGTSLCRSILKSSIDKFCGMAPNALEYAKVLTDLLQFSPASLKAVTDGAETNSDGLDDRQKEEVISLAMATHHIPMLIDTLSNVPGGGMHHHVASQAIIPAIGNLLLLQAAASSLRPGLAGYLWKKNDIIDHVDHALLLAKKSLFCIDEDKRKCAATMLVSLIGVAVIASSTGNKRTMSKWSPVLDELRGCLRRCLTQHQQSVRIEAYSSLVAIMPSSASSSATQTQDSISPKSAASQSPAQSRLLHSIQSIPASSKDDMAETLCSILLTQIERYMTTPKEKADDKKARRQRATAMGSQLSQMAEEELPDANDNSMPLRFEMFITTRSPQAEPKTKGKSKKSVSIGQTLLNEALQRINEPLGFLIATCNVACSWSTSSTDEEIKCQVELKQSLSSLRRRMAGCHDIEEYLKWIKTNKQILTITNNARRKEEMAMCKISTLVSVAVAAEALLSTCEWENDDSEGFIGVDTTSSEVENLFNLRQDAIIRASEILSSFVNTKPNKAKKLKERDANADETGSSKKKKSKRSKKNDEEELDNENDKVTTTEVNRTVQAKNKKLIEDAISSITPALSQDFLSKSLREFGARAEKTDEVRF